MPKGIYKRKRKRHKHKNWDECKAYAPLNFSKVFMADDNPAPVDKVDGRPYHQHSKLRKAYELGQTHGRQESEKKFVERDTTKRQEISTRKLELIEQLVHSVSLALESITHS